MEKEENKELVIIEWIKICGKISCMSFLYKERRQLWEQQKFGLKVNVSISKRMMVVPCGNRFSITRGWKMLRISSAMTTNWGISASIGKRLTRIFLTKVLNMKIRNRRVFHASFWLNRNWMLRLWLADWRFSKVCWRNILEGWRNRLQSVSRWFWKLSEKLVVNYVSYSILLERNCNRFRFF